MYVLFFLINLYINTELFKVQFNDSVQITRV